MSGVTCMPTSRTGTAEYKNWRRRVLARARRAGVTKCPLCGVTLDYTNGMQPNSAVPDHILAWANGGRNTLANGRAICRRCNESKGSRPQPSSRGPQVVTTLTAW